MKEASPQAGLMTDTLNRVTQRDGYTRIGGGT